MLDLDPTTPNVRTSRSVSGGRPAAVELAAIVSAWVPTDKVGSGTETSLKAVPETRVGARPSDGAATVNATGSPAWRSEPKARSLMIGRSAARYSSATVASTKNGNPTDSMSWPSPALNDDVTALALRCHAVRSSESRKETVARPSAAVSSWRKNRVSRKSSRASPPPSPPPPAEPPSPSEPSPVGSWWVAVSRTMPLSTRS